MTKREISLLDLGRFDYATAKAIAEATEGKSFYNFHVEISGHGPNCSLCLMVSTDDTDEEVKSMFVYCALSSLARMASK